MHFLNFFSIENKNAQSFLSTDQNETHTEKIPQTAGQYHRLRTTFFFVFISQVQQKKILNNLITTKHILRCFQHVKAEKLICILVFLVFVFKKKSYVQIWKLIWNARLQLETYRGVWYSFLVWPKLHQVRIIFSTINVSCRYHLLFTGHGPGEEHMILRIQFHFSLIPCLKVVFTHV